MCLFGPSRRPVRRELSPPASGFAVLPSFFLSFSLSEACRSERASEQATKRQMHLSELDAEETDIKRLKKQNAESVGGI